MAGGGPFAVPPAAGGLPPTSRRNSFRGLAFCRLFASLFGWFLVSYWGGFSLFLGGFGYGGGSLLWLPVPPGLLRRVRGLAGVVGGRFRPLGDVVLLFRRGLPRRVRLPGRRRPAGRALRRR